MTDQKEEKDKTPIREWLFIAAEIVDVWRVIPRVILVAYGALLVNVIQWYRDLTPYFPKEVKHLIEKADTITPDIMALMVQAPTTQHAALVTAVVGISAAIFGLYSNSGRKWDTSTKEKGD